MNYQVDNAVILAAGMSNRFVPVSQEKPKALLCVQGEILIERQIRQLKEAGINQIIIVVGYLKEQFLYLEEKFDVLLIENKEYADRNNHSSLYAVKEYLKNTYICSADNYFSINPFTKENAESYYAAVYAHGKTKEWCMQCDEEGYIRQVTIGGYDSWYMLGHVFFTEEFSRKFLAILQREYHLVQTKDKLWEAIFAEHIAELPMKIKKYAESDIYEFDTLEELREFDNTFLLHSGSAIMQEIAQWLQCKESLIREIKPIEDRNGRSIGMRFTCNGIHYRYHFQEREIVKDNERDYKRGFKEN